MFLFKMLLSKMLFKVLLCKMLWGTKLLCEMLLCKILLCRMLLYKMLLRQMLVCKMLCKFVLCARYCWYNVAKRPGVSGAVLHTPSSLIKRLMICERIFTAPPRPNGWKLCFQSENI